jgi:DNA polymerase elongation subunit (family B)
METVRARDPDIIEGHNILGFDLPYLQDRCALHGLTLDLGRVRGGRRNVDLRPGSAERYVDRAELPGRQVVDTYHLVQSYDAAHRVLESHSLKAAARHFGLSGPDRTHIPGDRISWHWENDPEPLVRYARDDVRETRLLSDRLWGSSFHLAQMLPLPPGTVARSGSAAKIESLLLRAYLRSKQAVPTPSPALQTTGGYTDIFLTGVVGPVVHVDVESLYPSLMITRGIWPSSDTLEVFPVLLRDLTALRLDAKRGMRDAADPAERSRLNVLQSSFKVLINSFYGYLGYGRGLFNDPRQADAVTRAGQDTLRTMIAAIAGSGGRVVEVDTDGVFFVPPGATAGVSQGEDVLASLGAVLPAGITVVADGHYPKMLSYKKKNYALLTADGGVLLRGSSLISRSMERYLRSFIRTCVERMLHEDVAGIHRAYAEMEERIRLRRMDVREFSRTETLRDPLEEYLTAVQAGTRNRSAAYEVAAARPAPVRPGDRISFYVTGTDPSPRGWERCRAAEEWDPHFPDENTAWYLRRLQEVAEKFAPFFSARDFRAVFSADDLFPFTAEGISLLVTSAGGSGGGEDAEEDGEP